ncbi:hypothetical protein [Hymenobacter sp. J193]|uniref:hypothetical protein n=1 Tax=Hymenobacter sp. J193 TaxID=2898429 RepID=UPI0027E3AB26|nr:hypothetical protein [Hymenobacter sp. J193]
MNTNESNNPQNTGTGSGSNYGTGSAGTGYGSGDHTTSSGNIGNSSTGSGAAGDDYSATAKGAAVAGTAGAVVGRGVDAVQNATDEAAHAVTGQPYQNTSGPRVLTSTFRDRESAERAYTSLSSRGYSKDDVNLLMSDDTRKTHFGDHTPDTDLGDKAMEGAGVGSAIGGTAGAVIGAIAAIGTSVALPGLGLIIAGPIAAALAGAGAGGLTGGLVGALVGSGIPEDRAAEYESDIKNGGIVMGVKPRNEEDARYFESEFRRHNGDRIYS